MKAKDIFEGIQQRTRSGEQGRAKYPGKQFFATDSGWTKAKIINLIQERMVTAEHEEDWHAFVGHKFDESKISNDMMQRFADKWHFLLEDGVSEHALDAQEELVQATANKIADW